MATISDLKDDVEELVKDGGIIDQLRALLPEPVQASFIGTTAHHKISGSPWPWHVEAGPVYMIIHAGARELERDLAGAVHGRLRRRGGSEANTRTALRRCVSLAEAAGAELVDDAASRTSRWIRQATDLADIDLSEPWLPLPREKGARPPPCPYCGLYTLRLAYRSGRVMCIERTCRDESERRPHATIEVGRLSGSAILRWRDGKIVAAAGLYGPQSDEQGES